MIKMILWYLLLSLFMVTLCNGVVTHIHGLLPGLTKLDRMVTDEKSGYVYIGATNIIYIRDTNLNSVKKIFIGPHNDSLYCPPNPEIPCECKYSNGNVNITRERNDECQKYVRTPTDAVVKNIIVDNRNQQLIVCSNLFYGYCTKISMVNYDVESVYIPVVSNSLDGKSVAFIAPSDYLPSALYFGVTRDVYTKDEQYKTSIPMLAVRNIDSFKIAHLDSSVSSASFLDIRNELRDNFPVNFKYGFSYNGYSYFLITRRESPRDNNTASYISRVCENDPGLESYVEMKIECVSEDFNYNSIDTAYITNIGSDLADLLGISRNDKVMFALFSTTMPDSFLVSDHSTGVCMYSLNEVESKFRDVSSYCYSGFGMTGPEYIEQPKPCQVQENKDFCRQQTNNWPIFGKDPAPLKSAYSFIGERFTSIAVKRAAGNKFTVGYLGTQGGNLVKVVFQSAADATVLSKEQVSGDGKSIKTDMVFDATEKNLFVMTEKQVMKVLLYNCSKYLDCETCLSAKDPHCGWCNLQNECTETSSCELSSKSYGWISYEKDVCPNISNITPKIVALNSVTSTEMIMFVNFIPPEFGMFSLMCEQSYGGETDKSDASSVVGGVHCTKFKRPPSFPSNTSVSKIDVYLWIQVNDRRWIGSQVTVYDCSRKTSCGECVQSDLPCIWCLKSNQCMDERDSCINSSAILSPRSSLKDQSYSSADQINSSFCPQVKPMDKSKYFVAAGDAKGIQLWARQLLDFQTHDLRCRFAHLGEIVVGATYQKQLQAITCEATDFNYPTSQGFFDYPVEVLWDTDKLLDNPKHIAVHVYKCEYLATSCGICTLLDPDYGCVWCNNKCSTQQSCEEEEVLTVDDICPDPAITKISPTLGPYLGGTNLTIEGINLGKTLEDIDGHVYVAGVKCKEIKKYKPATSLVCVTADSSEERTGNVKIKVGGDPEYMAESEELYRYQDPVLPVYSPKRGPVAGGTHVTITGQYLDMGSQVRVVINGRDCPVIRRDNSILEFVTSPQPAAINGKIHIIFDNTKDFVFSEEFAFIANPRVTVIYPQTALLSGGSDVVVNGTNLNSSSKPMFFVQKDDNKIFSNCKVESKKTLLCPLPELGQFDLSSNQKRSTESQEELLRLNYGLKIDDWHVDLEDLSYDLDVNFHPITVYKDPVIFTFPDSKPYVDQEDGMTFEIHGQNLDVLDLVPGIQVTVGNTSCEITQISSDMIIPRAPASPAVIDTNGNAQVFVVLGNFKASAGYIQYASGSHGNTGVILGVLFGVVIPVILIVIVLFIFRRSKRKKADHIPVPKDNGVAEKGNIYTPPADKEKANISEMLPLKDLPPNSCDGAAKGPVTSDGEEEEVASDKPFQLSDFLERIRDPKLRAHVQEVIVPLDRLDMKDMIGRGNFGCVYMADMQADQDENSCRVAVKTLQGERLEQHTVEAFLKEGVIMKNFNHPHVLKLLGVCVDHQENPMVILPYMANGDLRTYVKDKKKNFTARQLLHLAQQVAEGMAYLSSLNFVHRDLAARNCMIDELDTVKVADFGLTRDLFEKQYFSTNLKEKRGKMPIKWMALESLEEFVFTTKSDVWSFGVLMWELMTRGVTPYPDVDIFDVRNYLASDRRLRKPKYCPENIYSIMIDCWHADPDIRPTFTGLVNRIELLLNPPRRKAREETSGEPMYVNIRKANSTEYLKPVDGSVAETPSPSPHENSTSYPVA